jgi:hypothetical protein
MNVKTTVQLIDRSLPGTAPSGPAVPPFTPEQSTLAISLLEQYAERARVIGSPDAEVAVSAARIHQEMLLAGRARAAAAPPVRVQPAQPIPTSIPTTPTILAPHRQAEESRADDGAPDAVSPIGRGEAE